ncbi:MAG: hypothetical protein WEB33_04190 [Bacteroidota bacterium]
MKRHTQSTMIVCSGFVLFLVLWSPAKAQSSKPAKGKMMMEHCKDMKEQKQKMKEDMKAQDAKLTDRLAAMNGAPEGRKMVLMAEVITLVAEQRITMNARHATMEEEMMKHMMEHMQMGGESMSKCPMMKGMKSMEKKSEDPHKEHQEKH